MDNIKLRFDFEKQPLLFKEPKQIYTTSDLNEVKPILEQLEIELTKGRYVAGYLSYEAAPAFEPRFAVKKQTTMPLLWFASFEQPLLPSPSKPNRDCEPILKWQSVISYQDYQAGIAAIKTAIQKGDTYQVNYTTRLVSPFTTDPETFYHQLTERQKASYSAYLDIGEFQVLSASPELFFSVHQNEITTRPMKGTIKRGRTLAEDQANKAYLIKSEKERAENLMIVDLLRNDLGKIAVEGTVHVPELLTVETYPTVHQMTSTVKATLKPESQMKDWFDALFPCGSITGAPKLKTMSYINALETTPREVYCGAIGYVTPNRDAIFNVPIRTVVIDQEKAQATYGVGGGITWDSATEHEYEEIKTKAALLTAKNVKFDLLESILLNHGKYPLLSYHLERLSQSATYFNYHYDPAQVKDRLEQLAVDYPTASYKVRLQVARTGMIKVELELVQPIQQPVKCYLAEQPIDLNDPFYYHKTTARDNYDKLMIDKPGNFATLLWNEEGELTEFTIGNLVIETNGIYKTPPIESGLLAGTLRQQLLDQKVVDEQIIFKEELEKADKIWLINGVRGWVEVQINYP